MIIPLFNAHSADGSNVWSRYVLNAAQAILHALLNTGRETHN